MDEKEKDKRIYLSVPYKQKDEAKKLGARWDPIVKKWYIPSSVRVDVSINAQKLLEMWGEEDIVDDHYEVMNNDQSIIGS